MTALLSLGECVLPALTCELESSTCGDRMSVDVNCPAAIVTVCMLG